MSAIPKRKLCWQCEGNVGFEEDTCPYCGVYLHGNHPDQLGRSPFADIDTQSEAEAEEATPALLPSLSSLHLFGAICFLLLGTTSLLFACILFMFSHDGVFTLQWDASYWYLYLSAALPLLYYGKKALNALQEPSE